MVEQHRANGRGIGTGHGITKAEIGCHQLHGVTQTLAAQIDQPFEHTTAHLQLRLSLGAHSLVRRNLDSEIDRTHDNQQQDNQNPGDARLKAGFKFHSCVALWKASPKPPGAGLPGLSSACISTARLKRWVRPAAGTSNSPPDTGCMSAICGCQRVAL